MTIQKIRQKLLLLCSICEEHESAEWITTATALWEVRVNKLKKLYSI